MRAIALRMIVTLTVVAILAGLALARSYQYAHPLIEANKLKELKEAIFVVLPGAERYDEIQVGKTTVYRGMDVAGSLIGYAFIASGGGFQGKLKIMIGIGSELIALTGIRVLESLETPGLGAKITEAPFESQFSGLEISPPVQYVKNRRPDEPKAPNEIDAITGATISSKAVVHIINTAASAVVPALKSGG